MLYAERVRSIEILLKKIKASYLLRDPLPTLYLRDATWVSGTAGRVFMALYLRDNFGGKNYKMGPPTRMVDLTSSLGHLGQPCWLKAFECLDVVLAVGRGRACDLPSKGSGKTLAIDNFFKLLICSCVLT